MRLLLGAALLLLALPVQQQARLVRAQQTASWLSCRLQLRAQHCWWVCVCRVCCLRVLGWRRCCCWGAAPRQQTPGCGGRSCWIKTTRHGASR
jgi:hypothetical protein